MPLSAWKLLQHASSALHSMAPKVLWIFADRESPVGVNTHTHSRKALINAACCFVNRTCKPILACFQFSVICITVDQVKHWWPMMLTHLSLTGFILVNLSASWRHNSSNLASDPPTCAASCGILSATSTLNLTTTSSLALR